MAVHTIAVYGANGHTGRFVLAELKRRGQPAVAVGRDAARLPAGVPARVAAIDDPQALDQAFADCAVVINCAGPFLDTATPIVESALRIKASYIDVTAEQPAALALFETYHAAAKEAGIAIIPAAGFYGGLADLLASALAGAGAIDEMAVAVALDHWWPTEGTRKTGERNASARMMVDKGQLLPIALPAQHVDWDFAAPFGTQDMTELSFSEVVTIFRHLPVASLRSYINTGALEQVRDTATPQPTASDADGRSAQRFMLDVLVRDAAGERRARAAGQDIYAVSAPIVVEAAARMLAPSFDRRGVLALGQAVDPRSFLASIASPTLAVDLPRA